MQPRIPLAFLTAELLQIPLSVVEEAGNYKQDIEATWEEAELPSLPQAQNIQPDHQPPAELEAENSNPGTVKVKAPTKISVSDQEQRSAFSKSKRHKSCTSVKMILQSRIFFFSRSSRNNTAATGNIDACAQGDVSTVTTKFYSRLVIFKTPALHTPALNEHVYTISANGSSLADINDIFISVPVGGGESICLRPCDLTKKNLYLSAEAQGIVNKLSVNLFSVMNCSCNAAL
nr:PREDICTED: borealin {ECO:0000250/UniProtKB:Q3KPK4}-like [Struthio camelus australis]